jgi:diadenosine tetraphosphatase ApaH/serine/threonine PP2A family protein phosphatase
VSPTGSRVVAIDRPSQRLACLADVHANVAALDAVLASGEFATADAVAFLGCTTSGPEPQAVLERCADLKLPTFFLAGNGERAIIEIADGKRVEDDWPPGQWMADRHGEQGLETIRSWPAGLIVQVEGLGAVRLCHGSPRSDIELLTPLTNDERIEAANRDVEERVIVHGHTHIQYERTVNGKRIVGPGSVGLPYTTGDFGARWALLGPDIEPIQTPYRLSDARSRIEASGYPSLKYLNTLENPPDPEEIIRDCEVKRFSD